MAIIYCHYSNCGCGDETSGIRKHTAVAVTKPTRGEDRVPSSPSKKERNPTMICKTSILFAITALAGSPPQAMAAAIDLGTAGNFAVLAGSAVTNTGPSIIDGGNVGVSPGTAVSGFPPGIVMAPHTIHAADAVALQAQSDLTTAY